MKTLAEKFAAICDEIFERWDKDQRSGKLLSALSGNLPRYRQDVTEVRRAIDAHGPLMDLRDYIDEHLGDVAGGDVGFAATIAAHLTAIKFAIEGTLTGLPVQREP